MAPTPPHPPPAHSRSLACPLSGARRCPVASARTEAAPAQDGSGRPRPSASSRPARPGPGRSPASSPGGAGRLFPAESSQRLRPLHRPAEDAAAAPGREGRRGGGAARVKGRAATSPGAGLGPSAQDRLSRQPQGLLTSGWGGAAGRASVQVRGVAKGRRPSAEGQTRNQNTGRTRHLRSVGAQRGRGRGPPRDGARAANPRVLEHLEEIGFPTKTKTKPEVIVAGMPLQDFSSLEHLVRERRRFL